MSDISRKSLINRIKSRIGAVSNNPASEFIKGKREAYEQVLIDIESIPTESEGEATIRAENERLLAAIRSAHLSLTWSNTENQVPHAVWHLEQALSSHREDAETEIQVNLTHNDIFQLRSLVNDNGADAIIGLIRSWGIKDGRDNIDGM